MVLYRNLALLRALVFFWSSTLFATGETPVATCPEKWFRLGSTISQATESYEIDPEKVESWIRSHPKARQEGARFLSTLFRHVPKQEFEERLGLLVEDLLKKEPFTPGNPITILLPAKQGSSERWVTAQVVDVIQKQFPHRLKDITLVDLANNPDLNSYKNVIVFDDAIFSGTNLFGNIRQVLLDGYQGTVHLAIVGATDSGSSLAKVLAGEKAPQVVVHRQFKIETVREALDRLKGDPSKRPLVEEIESNYIVNNAVALLYFDHKIPGAGPSSLVSNEFGGVLNGYVLGVPGKQIPLFKPGTDPKPPYRDFRFPN